MPTPVIAPRNPKAVLLTNPYCAPLRSMYDRLTAAEATSWNQVEEDFLAAMSDFDAGLPTAFEGDEAARQQQNTELSAAIQNGKGDWFNNVLAQLLERCAGLDTLYVRRSVPGLIIPQHNLDGVYPGDPHEEISFLLEAKMMGTPKHANSPGEKLAGRAGSADTNKRIKELAFKSIDLKGEASRRLAMAGTAPTGGGAGGGDLSTWLHSSRPLIYFFMAVRVISSTDFEAVLRWAETAAMVVDAVGLYCFEPKPGSLTAYRRRAGVPASYQLERVLYRACLELRNLRELPQMGIGTALPPSPAAATAELTRDVVATDPE
ncbi:MAG: hypothetical protein ACYDGN_10400 [Acidimicrobiales bacterium]